MQPFRLRYADRIAGAFLLAVTAVALVALALFIKGQSLFVQRVEYWTLFDDGAGIAPETPVKIAGLEVGKVRRVSLTDDNKVKVVFEVLEDFTGRIRQDPPGFDCEATADTLKRCGSRMTVSLPAGLGAFLPSAGLAISVGDPNNPPVEAGGFVKSVKAKGLQDILQDLQNEGVVQNAQDVVEQVAILLTRINDAKGPVWRSIENVEVVTSRVRNGQGVVGQALAPGSALEQKVNLSLERLDRALGNLEQASADIAGVARDVEGRRQDLLRFVDALDEVAHNARQMSEDLKAFARDSREVPTDVREAVRNLNARIDDLGDILRGLKQSFPINLVLDSPSEATAEAREPDAGAP